MTMTNCWEAKKCGREPGGSKVDELGVCPAATETKLDGYHNGTNAGRACWAVAGTYCGGKVQGTFATKEENCSTCDFYLDVIKAEGKNYTGVMPLLKKLWKK